MRVAVFSDIHGNLEALNAIIDHINDNNIDKIIYLGDAVSLGPNSNECVELLKSIPNLIYIYGNHELYCTRGYEIDPDMNVEVHKLSHHLWVRDNIDINLLNNELLCYDMEMNGKRFIFSHFLLKNSNYPFYQLDIFKENKYHNVVSCINYDYIFIGHYHDGLIDDVNGKHLYCVGSSGCVKNNETFYYVVDLVDGINVSKVSVFFDRELLINKLNGFKCPGIDDIRCKFFGM